MWLEEHNFRSFALKQSRSRFITTFYRRPRGKTDDIGTFLQFLSLSLFPTFFNGRLTILDDFFAGQCVPWSPFDARFEHLPSPFIHPHNDRAIAKTLFSNKQRRFEVDREFPTVTSYVTEYILPSVPARNTKRTTRSSSRRTTVLVYRAFVSV